MPGACLNSWQTDACEGSIGYVWRSSDWIERGIFIVLALMLAYTGFVLIRFSRHYYLVHRTSRALVPDSWRAFQRSQRTLVSDLSGALRTLKAIALIAPFLGLAGTCYGILAAFSFGAAMEKNALLHMLSANLAATLITAAAGILVAIPAVVSYNFLHAGIDRFERELSRLPTEEMVSHEDQASSRPFRFAQTLPLRRRFKGLPPFALIAAPLMACGGAMYTLFEPYVSPKGLPVRLVSDRCELEGDRPIVLRIRDTGELFINQEKEDWKNVADRLSQIYRIREHHSLYVLAEDGVSFQTVADAVDIAENSLVPESSSPDIAVWLITPRALQGCLLPVVIRSEPHDSR